MAGPSLLGFGRAAAESVRRAPDLVAALAPVGWPRPGARARYQASVAAAAGAPRISAQHERWERFYGSAPPLSDAALDGGVDRVRTRRLRALDAAVAFEVEADRAIETLRNPLRSTPADLAAAMVIASLTAPGIVAGATSSRLADALARSAPPLPPVRMPRPDRASLLTSTLATTVPEILRNSILRHLLLRWPNEITIGVRSGRSTSSVTIGRRGIRVTNGLARSAAIVVDGDVRPVLRRASGTLADELAALTSEFDDGGR